MTEEEKIISYISNCKCCLLADAMKTCPHCLFNIGLAEKVDQTEWIPLPVQFPVMMFEPA